MRKNALGTTVIQVGSNIVLDFAGRILTDYGVTVVKTADCLSGGKYTSDPNLDANKIISKDSVTTDKLTSVLQKARGVILHEDMPNLESNITTISKKHPHLVILVVHRISYEFWKRYPNKKPHDVNIQALSSILSEFGQTDNPKDNSPQHPSIISSLVGANMVSILLLNALFARPQKSNIIRFSLLHSSMFLNTFNLNSHLSGMTNKPRGQNILDGNAPFYRIYQTKDDYLAVGNLESKFYQEMLSGMELDEEKLTFLQNNQMVEEEWPKMKKIFEEEFKKKTTKEWMVIFNKKDTCISEIAKISKYEQILPWPRMSRHDPYPKL